MRRRTKIIATIGPASDSEATLVALVEAGMDVARIGLAHGDLDHHLECYDRIRKASVEADRPVGILVDLPGPKVRAGSFPESGVELVEGERIRLTPGFSASTAEVVEVGYERLVSDVEVGDRMLFGDGAVVIEVVDKNDRDLIATVAHGGKVQGRPGVHIPSDRLRIASPTPDDLRMLDAFVERGVDMVAVSFVRSAHDIRRVGTEPHPRGPLVVAKIETRAEVTDVANAVFDGTSVVMLSGETAIGHDPVLVVRTMADIARRADEEFDYDGWAPHITDLVHTEEGDADARVTDTMTMAAWRVAKEMRADAILCMSRTGFTVRAMARFRPKTKILGFSPDERTVRQLTMSWGAQPMLLEQRGSNESMVRAAVRAAREAGQVRSGDTVVVLAGSDDRSRATDVLRLVRVP